MPEERTTMLTSSPNRHPVEGTPEKTRVAIGCGVGACVETYDFIGFGTAAALYFGDAFFPDSDPLSATLLSFATLGMGFAVRPLGGVIGGYFGDRIGRKPVLVASLLLMGIATVLIGCLPTYAQVGVLAPILLVAVRVVQGLAFGAEWGGAILMTYEHAPWRRRGQYTAIPQAGFPVGLLLANTAFLLSGLIGGNWSWRIPFLLSAVLILIGLMIRMKIDESPEFEEIKDLGEVSKNPLAEVLRNDWRNVLRAFCLRIAETAGFAITFMLSYLRMGDDPLAAKSVTLTAMMTAAAVGLVATLFWGRLSDRTGRRPLYLVGCSVMIAFATPMFLLVNTGSAVLIVLTFVIAFAVCQNMLAAVQGAWFAELFQTKTRTSGASLAYQCAAVVSGFTPLLATSLYAWVGWIGPALLFGSYGLLGLAAALLTRETWGQAERAEIERLARFSRPTAAMPEPLAAPAAAI
jgi:MHS family shikimate/dehydroshikimate transporter-like MFS transporter